MQKVAFISTVQIVPPHSSGNTKCSAKRGAQCPAGAARQGLETSNLFWDDLLHFHFISYLNISHIFAGSSSFITFYQLPPRFVSCAHQSSTIFQPFRSIFPGIFSTFCFPPLCTVPPRSSGILAAAAVDHPAATPGLRSRGASGAYRGAYRARWGQCHGG